MRFSRFTAKLLASLCAVAVGGMTWALTFKFAPHFFHGPSHEWGWYAFLIAVVLSALVSIAMYKCILRFSILRDDDRDVSDTS